MNEHSNQVVKDFIFAAQSYLYWRDEWQSEQTYSALKNESTWIQRLQELLPMCLEWCSCN